MIQGKNPGVTPVWYMRQAGRSQAEYRKIKEKYTLFEITKEPELCARVTELPVKEYGVDAAILYKAINVLETITLDKESSHFKAQLAQKMGELVYNGQ
ncbi:uroporphyrinogen decarboxylase family protein, partial [uncultured Veillonella sp.]|uniref:uroporphyrinogen decarboxylase family protein n=1 Tax=uncultured Veillonella sp. TaxID=159268 RepID=UPI002625F251